MFLKKSPWVFLQLTKSINVTNSMRHTVIASKTFALRAHPTVALTRRSPRSRGHGRPRVLEATQYVSTNR